MPTTKEIVSDAAQRMDKSISVFKGEIGVLRAGRANPQMLDRILVDYMGAASPIKNIAGISVPEPRTLMISPWDPGALKEIEKAIQKSDLGINPTNDGKVIRLVIPELTQERRKELMKTVSKLGEECKVAIRAIRRDVNDAFKKMKKEGLSENEIAVAEEELTKLTEKQIKSIDTLIAEKEKEIMTV